MKRPSNICSIEDGIKLLRQRNDLVKRYPDAEGTTIYVAGYYNSTGLVMRSSGARKKIGYCSETPKEVLEKLMPDFYVTSYCGMELYSSSDCEGVPMRGISIGEEKFGRSYGKRVIIDGKLSELLEVEDDVFKKLKRKEPLSDKERLQIVGNISDYANSSRTDIYVARYKELMDYLTSRKGL
jgi:hypothetical protein